MWPAVKQMKEESYNSGYNMGALMQTNKLVNIHLLSVEQAAMSLNFIVDVFLAAVKSF